MISSMYDSATTRLFTDVPRRTLRGAVSCLCTVRQYMKWHFQVGLGAGEQSLVKTNAGYRQK